MTTVSAWKHNSGQSWAYSLHLPHDPRAVHIARRTLHTALTCHDMAAQADVAALPTSEMVTNAYQYSDGPIQLCVRLISPHRLRVSVWDSNPTIPEPFHTPPTPLDRQLAGKEAAEKCDDLGGRGLLLIRLWADSWGARSLTGSPLGIHGKLLWFELA